MSRSSRIFRWWFAPLLAGAAYFLFWPVPIEPAAWQPPPDSPLTASVETMHVQQLPEVGPGPEAVAAGPGGWLYSGLDDGRVVRMRPEGGAPETIARTGGRPLGIKFDAAGNLVVADAFRGLLTIARDGSVSVLADSVDGKPLQFANDLDIARDGAIWFSQTSQRHDQRHWMREFWESRPTGRLLRYDPRTRRAEVRLEGLAFANGVALGPDDAFVLVCETTMARIARLWLTGPRAGQSDTFAILPGYPDNLTYNGQGIFWVAVASPRVKALEALADWPGLRRALYRIPAAIRDLRPEHAAWVMGLDTQGKAVREFRDSAGYGSLASAVESGGRLYLGSIETRSVGWAGIR